MVRVRKIDKVNLDDDVMSTCSSAHPIRLSANAFGLGRPMKEMTVLPEPAHYVRVPPIRNISAGN